MTVPGIPRKTNPIPIKQARYLMQVFGGYPEIVIAHDILWAAPKVALDQAVISTELVRQRAERCPEPTNVRQSTKRWQCGSPYLAAKQDRANDVIKRLRCSRT